MFSSKNLLSASIALTMLPGSMAHAEPKLKFAHCDIVLIDLIGGDKSVILEAFSLIPDPDRIWADRRHFGLPGIADGRCTLAFFPDHGTSLSCEMDPLGLQYVQSYRSMQKEFPNKNQLIFRFNDVHVSIDVTCSPSSARGVTNIPESER